jgi:hypothetical protein
MDRATKDDSTGLPPGFEYMTPPPGWPPAPSPEQLKLMAQRLQKALERDRAFSDSCRRITVSLRDDA